MKHNNNMTQENFIFPTPRTATAAPNYLQELWELMKAYGLNVRGWSAKFTRANATRLHGCADYRKREIRINRAFCALATQEDRKDLYLHEIAHVLAYIRHGERCGHDRRWKAICREIGAKPERLYKGPVSVSTAKPGPKWEIYNTRTGKVYSTRHRRPMVGPTTYITGKKRETLGHLAVRPA